MGFQVIDSPRLWPPDVRSALPEHLLEQNTVTGSEKRELDWTVELLT